jgi:cell division protein FtsB
MAHRKQGGLTIAERRLIRRVLLLCGAAGILWLLFAPGWGFLHYTRLQNEVETLARENRTLEARNADLKKEIERLQNDDSYLEEVARKKYGLLKENEMVYEYKPSREKK